MDGLIDTVDKYNGWMYRWLDEWIIGWIEDLKMDQWMYGLMDDWTDK